MMEIKKYIPLHMESNFLDYVFSKHKMTKDEVCKSELLESIASEYLFEKKESNHEEIKIKKTEEQVFGDILMSKFSDVEWESVTELVHVKVRIPDSATPVYAMEIMYGNELYSRLVMRDYKKSLRFMSYVYKVWFTLGEQPH